MGVPGGKSGITHENSWAKRGAKEQEADDDIGKYESARGLKRRNSRSREKRIPKEVRANTDCGQDLFLLY